MNNANNQIKTRECSNCGIEVLLEVGNYWCKSCIDKFNKEIDEQLKDSRIYVNKKLNRKKE